MNTSITQVPYLGLEDSLYKRGQRDCKSKRKRSLL